MKTVIFVNGAPRAGKDTVIEFMQQHLDARNLPSGSFSSIDPVRAMLNRIGMNTSGKTEADRKLLATIGDALEEHSKRRSSWCVWNAVDFFSENGFGVFFLHVREPLLIQRITAALAPLGITCLTVFVDGARAEYVFSNPADAGVADMVYDHTLLNNGTLEDLRAEVVLLLKSVLPRTLVQHSVE